MPLMSTRSKGAAPNKSTPSSGSGLTNEQLKRKAKLQLMGSAVLVLVGVVFFAVVLDHPPRPTNTEVALLIPARDSIAPLASASAAPVVALPEAPASAALRALTAASPAAIPTPTASTSAPGAPIESSAPAAPSAPAPTKTQPTVTAKASLDPNEVLVPTPAKAASAVAPLAAESVASGAATPSATQGRFVLQVGAYTDPQKLKDVRLKLERAGIKTYTQVIQNAEGQRTRVRVGPFATKAEAEKVAAKVKSLDLPVAMLTL